MFLNIDFDGNILGFAYFIDDVVLLSKNEGEFYDVQVPIRIDYMNNLYYLLDNTMIIDARGSVLYNDSYHSYKAGKPSSIGYLSIDYNDSYHSYKAGKISKIGDVYIEYNDSYNSYKAGKPSKIGSTYINYNDSYHSYNAGKISSIG